MSMNHQDLVVSLKKLNLSSFVDGYIETAKSAEKAKHSHEQYLASLVSHELAQRQAARLKRLIKEAQIPVPKTLASYDYACRQGISPEATARLAAGNFLCQATNVVLYGGFGVGKSHLAAALTSDICTKGYRGLFTSVHAMISELLKAHHSLTLTALFKKLDRFDLITLDELGYTPQSQEGADLFFQLISQRYERKSLMITTNLPYSEWDKVFINQMSTAAAVDRIIHNCETFNITGPSWRAETAKKKAALKTK
jgi:DNA replication protein DnaC